MSLTLATVADALIEFILSLLRDPDVAAEFERDPDQALATRGLQHAGPSDVAAVAPVIIERTQVMQVAVPKPVYIERDHSPVVREINQVTSHMQWVDDRDTIVDQSVNQNIWAEGDVTQTFDNEAIVASGDEAVAAGEDATVDKTWDESTTIEAGEDVNIGNATDVEVIEGSMNEESDDSTASDSSVEVIVDESFDTVTDQVAVEESFNESEQSASAVGAVADTENAVETVVAGDESADPVHAPEAQPLAPVVEVVEESVTEPLEEAYDSAADYLEADLSDSTDDGLAAEEPMIIDEGANDDTF